MRNWLGNGRFQHINLLCASTAALLLYFLPGIGGWPLLIFVLPWGLYFLVQRRFPFRHTMLDWFLLLFVVTAVIGVWAAYNTAIAFTYLWWILGAVMLFYAITAGPTASPSWLVGMVCVLAVIISGHFLLTHNWQETPASTASLNLLATAWLNVRPTASSLADPNAAEGFMVIAFPILLAQTLWAVKTKHRVWLAAAVLAVVLVLIGLLFSTSRGAWVALFTGLSFWILWRIGVKLNQHLTKRNIFILLGLLIVGSVIGISLLSTTTISTDFLNWLSGLDSAGSRLRVAQDTLDLIEDFLFTGGGLGTYSGLYSHYILLIPYQFMSHSHDVFLDITLAQGIGGLLAFAGILGVTILLLVIPQSPQEHAFDPYRSFLLKGALAASLIAFVVHGFLDDPLFSSEGAVFLFLIPGMIVWWRRPEPQLESWYRSKWVPGVLAVSIFCVLLIMAFYKPVSARWQANLGAVQMAKVELRDWPSIKWNDSRNAAHLTEAEARFTQALADNPAIRTAYHRLGSLQMLRHEYDDAVASLEMAYEIDPKHNGVRKALGYSYVWAGKPEMALPILAEVPEAYTELNTYVWWWQTQGYEDLSKQAALVVDEMD